MTQRLILSEGVGFPFFSDPPPIFHHFAGGTETALSL
jgi:hypothetical protein